MPGGLNLKIGFIGLGNMGSSLAAGLLDSGAISAGNVAVANRSPVKAETFARRYAGVVVAENNLRAAEGKDVIFVAVRTDQLLGVLREVSSAGEGVHLVVVNGALPLSMLEGVCKGPVSKLVPSVTMEHGRGVSLVSHGPSVSPSQARSLERALGRASKVVMVPEDKMDVAADLTSCGPALIAEMMHQFAEAGVRHGIARKDAWDLVLETMQGAALALASGESAASLKEKVATKGGITEQGLLVLEAGLPAVFDEVMDRTMAKHAEVRKRLMKDIVP
jgi:pyrroline-5-carboxylate reductase